MLGRQLNSRPHTTKKRMFFVMSVSTIFIGILCAVTAQPGVEQPASMTIKNCYVKYDEEAKVAAQEPGVILLLPVKEGQYVKAGELLAQVDDKLPMRDMEIANFKLKVAQEQAASDINVRYSKKAAEVARAKCAIDEKANRDVRKSVPEVLVDQHLLEADAAALSIEKSDLELKIAKLQVNVSQAELDAAKEKVDHRRIKSPLTGQVRKINPHVGEWVQPGDVVMHVVEVNRLRVEGFVNVSDFSPEEIIGQPVTVKAVFARGRIETFNGNIVFVDPKVQGGGSLGTYLFRALIQNREVNGQWLLRDGMTAEVTIQLK
jgi:multidrug efflux pump subunit AcrA (membrane-fusion protein)